MWGGRIRAIEYLEKLQKEWTPPITAIEGTSIANFQLGLLGGAWYVLRLSECVRLKCYGQVLLFPLVPLNIPTKLVG